MRSSIRYFVANKLAVPTTLPINNDALQACKQHIRDKHYFTFLEAIGNGGFFFGQSLQLYAIGGAEDFLRITSVNAVLHEAFGPLFDGLYTFGQDIFGYQFAFDTKTCAIVLFNIETAERQPMAKDFSNWLDIFQKRKDYYSGAPYAQAWQEAYPLAPSQRLVPKKPFVLGGEFAMANLYTLDFPKYLAYNADLAKQIVNLKDGQQVSIVIKKP